MDPTSKAPYFALWAKTADSPSGPRWHPLAYHLLDVAAVAERLLSNDSRLAALAARQTVEPAVLFRFVLLLIALHDIGKASVTFQRQDANAAMRLAAAGFAVDFTALPPRPHASVTAHYLSGETPVARALEALAPASFDRLGPVLIDPIAGHHGRPVEPLRFEGNALGANKPFLAAAGALTADLIALFDAPRLPKDFLRRPPRDRAAFSWLLASLTPVADWIGSNQEWFPPREPDLDLARYWWEIARPFAERALTCSGLDPAKVSLPGAERTLPPFAEPTPLQSHALDLPLPEGQALFVIEDATGAGKTEAALTLAHRLMSARLAAGFHFSLPTLATADAMFDRLAESYRKLFDSPASLSLAHGRASQRYESEAAVAAACADWIADDRRKAFLAQAGAGTIDQALMAVLPAKYQTLRLFGLRSKVLIVDEVHSYDPFMRRELETLIEMHALLGGSIILMSATLPLATRRTLAAAFARGIGVDPKSLALASRAYPLLTTLDMNGVSETPVALASRSRRRVEVERVDCVEDGERAAVELAERGACVALIRTTVDAAIASRDRLCAALGVERVELLHSRFLARDRRVVEQAILSRFGRTSTPEARRGRILVATQVIEQSLDVDFDVLITDLAPIDLVIQRAGRLWRHQRENRPVEEPVLRVISPPPHDHANKDWLGATLPEAAWVYRDTALLWLTARTVFGAGAIMTSTLAADDFIPDHVRRLVDAVYEAPPESLPSDDLRQVADACRGQGYAKANLADFGLLNPADGYVHSDHKWRDDAEIATRLEEPARVALRLAIEDGERLVPLSGEMNWALSELRVTRTWVKGLEPPDAESIKRVSPAWAESDASIRLLVLGGEQRRIPFVRRKICLSSNAWTNQV